MDAVTRTSLCLLLLALPGSVAGQAVHVAPFAGRNTGLEGAPPMVGLAVSAFPGAVGVRVSGSLDVASTPLAGPLGHEPAPALQAWSADLDMVLDGARVGLSLGPLEPSVFAGFGVHGIRQSDGAGATIPTWSYGAGAALPLTRWLALEAEGRYRLPHESRADLLPAGVEGGWELRAGLSLRLGRTAAARRPRAAPARRPAPYPGSGASERSTSRPSADAAAVAAVTIETGDRYVGTPYRWGGDSPSEGFDCSGFVQYVYGRNGIRLPRVSRSQARAGWPVSTRRSGFREGDLLFFAGADGVIDHVAIYVGGGTILHASASRGAVAYDRLDSRRGRWYRDHLVAVRRVIPDR